MVNVISSVGAHEVEIPDSWAAHNWEHPFVFLHNAEQAPARESHSLIAPRDKINSGWQYHAQLSRRSLMGRSGSALTFDEFFRIIATLFTCLADHPGLFGAVGTRSVEGFRDDAYICHPDPRSLRPQTAGEVDWCDGIQGQGWARGPGACVMLGADWTRMANDPVQRESDYAHVLFDTGRVGQSLTMEARNMGLRCRMTPAVRESFFSDLLSLDEEQDILYYLEVARPAEHPGETRG